MRTTDAELLSRVLPGHLEHGAKRPQEISSYLMLIRGLCA